MGFPLHPRLLTLALISTATAQYAADAIAGFSYQGCVGLDQTSFDDSIGLDAEISPQTCQGVCQGNGFAWAAISAYVSGCSTNHPTITETLTDGDCLYTCADDSYPDPVCGGSSLNFDPLWSLFGPEMGASGSSSAGASSTSGAATSSTVGSSSCVATTSDASTTSEATSSSGSSSVPEISSSSDSATSSDSTTSSDIASTSDYTTSSSLTTSSTSGQEQNSTVSDASSTSANTAASTATIDSSTTASSMSTSTSTSASAFNTNSTTGPASGSTTDGTVGNSSGSSGTSTATSSSEPATNSTTSVTRSAFGSETSTETADESSSTNTTSYASNTTMTSPTGSAGASGSITQNPTITHTYLSTSMTTITSCPPTVEDCTVGAETTTVYPFESSYPASSFVSTAHQITTLTVTSCDNNPTCEVGAVTTSECEVSSVVYYDPSESHASTACGTIIRTVEEVVVTQTLSRPTLVANTQCPEETVAVNDSADSGSSPEKPGNYTMTNGPMPGKPIQNPHQVAGAVPLRMGSEIALVAAFVFGMVALR